MIQFKITLPREVPPDSRAELVRELEASAEVESSAARKMDFDAAQTLFVIAATVQTIDILWHWFQATRAKNKKWDVVVTMANGDQVHLQDVTLDELKRLVESGG